MHPAISKGSFVRIKHLCVLIHIRIKVDNPSSEYSLVVTRRCFLCGSFLLFMFYVCLYYAALPVLVALSTLAGKGLIS